MNYRPVYFLLLILFVPVFTWAWGFHGHRLINRKAIYSLPAEMFAFYKANIDFLEAHSIDPDKRRYVVEGEAVKHYIDLDHVFDGELYHWIPLIVSCPL
ncbi:MAG: hypothetical protein RIC15_04245, partial [Vicingaceae bacterium]